MRLTYLSLAALFAVGFSSSVVRAEDAPHAKLKVGVIAPLTGGVATWGLSVRTAIQIANAESTNPAELYIQDEETCVPTKALAAYKYLRTVKNVDMIVASCLEGARVIAPLAKKENIPFFISGRSSHEFQQQNPNALSWLSLLDYEGDAVVRLIKERGWNKGTAVVWSGYFGLQFAEGIKQALGKENVKFDYDIIEADQGGDPSPTEIQRALKNSPQAIFLMMSEPAAAFMVRELKVMNYTGAVILQSSMLQTYDKAVRESFAGALQQKFPVNQPQFIELQKNVKTKLNADVADDFIFSYDGFTAVLAAANQCKLQQPNTLRTCLDENLRDEKWHNGASGPFRFMKDGSTERPMIFKQITAGGFKDP